MQKRFPALRYAELYDRGDRSDSRNQRARGQRSPGAGTPGVEQENALWASGVLLNSPPDLRWVGGDQVANRGETQGPVRHGQACSGENGLSPRIAGAG
jgi:hypothetical protein